MDRRRTTPRGSSPPARRRGLALLLALLAAAAAPLGCAGHDVDPSGGGQRRSNEELSKEWRLYQKDDPAWPDARKRWLDGSPAERHLLLDNLLIELMADDSAGRGSGTGFRSARARRELTWFGSEAVAALVQGMTDLGARDKVDVVVLERLASALVELRAADALAQLAQPDPAGKPAVKRRLSAVKALAQLDDDQATKALLARLADDPDWQVRGAAAEALRKRATEPGVRRALHDAVADPDGFVRAQGVRALADGRSLFIADVPVDELFHFLSRDPAPAVRIAAAESLSLYAFEPSVAAALAAALRDPEPDVVVAAARALQSTGTRDVRLALVDALDRVHSSSTHDAVAAGVWNELIRVLSTNVGARPAGNTPAAWRALVESREDGS
jgi:HEAT repeat protein